MRVPAETQVKAGYSAAAQLTPEPFYSSTSSPFVDCRASHAAQLKLKAMMAESPQNKSLENLQSKSSSTSQHSTAQRTVILNGANWNVANNPQHATSILNAVRQINPLYSMTDVLSPNRTFIVDLGDAGTVLACYEEVPREVESASDSGNSSDDEPENHVGLDDDDQSAVDPRFSTTGWAPNSFDNDDDQQAVDPRFSTARWGPNSFDNDDDQQAVDPRFSTARWAPNSFGNDDDQKEADPRFSTAAWPRSHSSADIFADEPPIIEAESIEVGGVPGSIDRIPNGLCSLEVRGLLSCFGIFIETLGDMENVERISAWHFVTPENRNLTQPGYVLTAGAAELFDTLAGLSEGGTRRALIAPPSEVQNSDALQCIRNALIQRGINDIELLATAGNYEATITSYGNAEYLPV
jgi:hypothetical protein